MIQIKESVQKIQPYKPPLENRAAALKFDFNENTLGPSPKVIQTLKKTKRNFISTYPEYKKLTKKISEYCNLKSSNIIPTNGSDEALKLAIDCIVGKNDEVIIISPTFQMFKFYAQTTGGRIVNLRYNGNLSFPTEKVLKSINNRTKLVILCNPNNPTGTIIPNKDIRKIAEKAKNAAILVDEAYYEFSNQSAIKLLKKFKNIIITRTFSKAFGLAGLRLGYLIGNENLIKLLNRARAPYSVNSLAVKCGLAALDDLEYMKNYVLEVNESKQALYKFLKKKKIEFCKSKANFVLMKFGKQKNYISEQLKKTKILVRDVSKQPLLEGYLRINVGTIKQTKYFIKELNKILSKPLIVFDLDGIIIDVDNSYREAIKKTVGFFTGKPATNKEIQELKNTGKFNNDWALSKELIKKKGKKVELNQVIKKFQEYYLGESYNGLIENEKLLIKKETLERLSENYRLAVLTGRPKDETEFTMKRNKIAGYFVQIITLNELKEKLKPNPFGLNLLLSEFKTKNAYYLGDSLEDILAAKKARIKSIGFVKKNREGLRDLMKKNKADILLNDINEIGRVIL